MSQTRVGGWRHDEGEAKGESGKYFWPGMDQDCPSHGQVFRILLSLYHSSLFAKTVDLERKKLHGTIRVGDYFHWKPCL